MIDVIARRWLHEVTTRLPGRATSAYGAFDSVGEVTAALRRAEAAHGEDENPQRGRRGEEPTCVSF